MRKLVIVGIAAMVANDGKIEERRNRESFVGYDARGVQVPLCNVDGIYCRQEVFREDDITGKAQHLRNKNIIAKDIFFDD